MLKHAKKNDTEVKLYVDKGSRSPYVVAVKFGVNDWWRPLCMFDNKSDAERYYNDLLA